MAVLSLEFTDRQADRIAAAFGGDRAAAVMWLRERLVSHVLEQEQKRMAADALTAQREALAVLRAELEDA